MTAFDGEEVTGTITGYRWWELWAHASMPPDKYQFGIHGPEGKLFGAWSDWQAGENHARCLVIDMVMPFGNAFSWSMFGAPIRERHDAPDMDCRCGYWAFWGVPGYWRTALDHGYDIREYLRVYNVTPVLGVIEGWGRAVKGSLGFRCERAKITALLAPQALHAALSDAQPQAMLYTNAQAMYAEHPSGIFREENSFRQS